MDIILVNTDVLQTGGVLVDPGLLQKCGALIHTDLTQQGGFLIRDEIFLGDDILLLARERGKRIDRGGLGRLEHFPGSGSRFDRLRGKGHGNLVPLVSEPRLPNRWNQILDQGVQVPLAHGEHQRSDTRPVLRGIQLVGRQRLIQDAAVPKQVLRGKGK